MTSKREITQNGGRDTFEQGTVNKGEKTHRYVFCLVSVGGSVEQVALC